MWIPDSLVRKIRTTSLAAGAVSTITSFVVGIVAVWSGGNLPVSDHPLTSFSTIMVAISAFFAAVSGVAMMLGRKYIASSHVDVNATRRACRLALVVWIAAIVLAVLSCFNLVMVAGTSRYAGQSVNPEVAMFMLLPAVLIVVTGILFFVARWLLRPSPSLLRQHHASARA